MKHNKITISILMIFVILLSVGCSNNQENISDGNENVNADYDFLFQELEEKYDATLGIYALDTETNKEISYNADERFAYCSTYKALAAGAILEKYSIEELDNVIYFEEEDVLSYALFPQVATEFFKYREAQQTKVDAGAADTANKAYPV